MPSVSAMMRTKKMMDIAWSLTPNPPFRRSYRPHRPRAWPGPPDHPPVGPADIEVHENPGHCELREGVDPGQVYRPDDVHVQHRGERCQKRQTEVEDQEKDRRR